MIVDQFMRYFFAIVNILMDPTLWMFWLVVDASIHMIVHVLDHRICVCVKVLLYNFHIVLILFFKLQQAENYISFIKSLLDRMSSFWRYKVNLINVNEENIMRVLHSGICHFVGLVFQSKFIFDVWFIILIL